MGNKHTIHENITNGDAKGEETISKDAVEIINESIKYFLENPGTKEVQQNYLKKNYLKKVKVPIGGNLISLGEMTPRKGQREHLSFEHQGGEVRMVIERGPAGLYRLRLLRN